MPTVKQCKDHSENMKRVLEVEKNMVEVRSDISYIKRDVTEIKDKLNKFIDSAESKYAVKYECDLVNANQTQEIVKLKNEVVALQIKWGIAMGIVIVVWSIAQIGLKILGVY